MKISDLHVDQAVVESGTWVANIPELGNIRLLVRGAQNKDWRRMGQKLVQAIPRNRRVGNLIDPDDADRVAATLILNCGLLDWDGIEDDDGNPIPFDKKKAEQYLKVRKFREGAQWACDQVAEGTASDVEEIAGN